MKILNLNIALVTFFLFSGFAYSNPTIKKGEHFVYSVELNSDFFNSCFADQEADRNSETNFVCTFFDLPNDYKITDSRSFSAKLRYLQTRAGNDKNCGEYLNFINKYGENKYGMDFQNKNCLDSVKIEIARLSDIEKAPFIVSVKYEVPESEGASYDSVYAE